ncbi:MAG: contact-dependent growth inhibition system immunity protein [Zavarzinella sp.]
MEGVAWHGQTLDELEGVVWDEPDHPWRNRVREARQKPLQAFSVEDLRFMLGQQISLPVLIPMALDVLELVDAFAGGDFHHGTLLFNALTVDKRFWQQYPRLWHRMKVVLVDLHTFREYIEQELLPAARAFEVVGPASPQDTEAGAEANRDA